MTMSVHLRAARGDEAALLTDLAMAAKAHWGYSAQFMARCADELTVSEEEIARGQSCHIVAEHDGEVLGYYALSRQSGAVFELDALFVLPRRIGAGLGRRLLDHARGTATAMHAQCLLVQADPHAEGFYRRLGARVIGRTESSSIPGRHLPLLCIRLADPAACPCGAGGPCQQYAVTRRPDIAGTAN